MYAPALRSTALTHTQKLEKQREKNSSAAARKLQRKLTQPLDVSGQPGYGVGVGVAGDLTC